jgi:transcriptional regulator GlxA family with amidase domain
VQIDFLLFDEVTALDAVGPYEVLTHLPGARVRFVGQRLGRVASDGGLGMYVDATLDEVRATDLLLVPGGFGARKLQSDERVLAWMRAIDTTTRLTASVCTGSLLLGAAGLLRGRRATSHWAFYDTLAAHGATPVRERYVEDGKYRTAAGVSAGIDLALALAIELRGEDVAAAIQLSIEYDPAPPLNAGNAERVDPALRERMFNLAHRRDGELTTATSRG